MKKNYLSNPGYNYDQVNRASLACGPMVKWAIAQVIKPKQSLITLPITAKYYKVYPKFLRQTMSKYKYAFPFS